VQSVDGNNNDLAIVAIEDVPDIKGVKIKTG
jgi:hypothetical protein